MDKMKIGQNVKFCPIFNATLVHEFMRDAIAEPNPRYPTVYDSYLVDDALKEPLQHHWRNDYARIRNRNQRRYHWRSRKSAQDP